MLSIVDDVADVNRNRHLLPRTRPVCLLIILLALLGCDTAGARRNVHREIGELVKRVKTNPNDTPAYDELMQRAQSDYSFERMAAVAGLGALGTRAQSSTPILLQCLKSNDGFVRREAVQALGKVTVGSEVAISALKDQLVPFGGDVAWFAAESLGNIGPPARAAEKELRAAAKSPDSQLAYRAQRALQKLHLQ